MRKRKIVDNIQHGVGMENHEGVVWIDSATRRPKCSLWWGYKNASGRIRWAARHSTDANCLYKINKPTPIYKRIPK